MPMVGKTIKWYRNERGWTQEQLAEGICSPTHVSQLENDLIPSNKEILLKICRKLRMNEQKVVNEIDFSLMQKVEDWLKYIHEFDIGSANEQYKDLTQIINENTHYDIEYLYELALFGYYLISDQLIKVNEVFKMIDKYSELFKESDSYSFHKFLGIYYKRKGLFLDALDHLKTAEKMMGEEEDPELYLSLAITYSYINKILISNRYAQQAFKLFHEKLYYNRIIECQIILNQNYCIVEDFDSVEQQLERLVEVEDENVAEKTKANIYHYMGFVYFTKKQYDQAILCLNTVRKFNINQADFLKSRYALAYIYYNQEQYDKSLQEIEEGIVLAKEYDLERFIIRFSVLKIRMQNDKEKLVEYLRDQAIPFFQKSGEAYELKNYYRLMGMTLYDLKRYKGAAQYFMLLDHDRFFRKDY